LLPRKPGWMNKILNFYLSGLQKLEQRGKKCIELRGEYVGQIPSLVSVACFLPGRAKDLSAPPRISYPLIMPEVMLSYLPATRFSCKPSVIYVTSKCTYLNPFCFLDTPKTPLITLIHFTYTNALELRNLQYFYHFIISCTLITIRSTFSNLCPVMQFPTTLHSNTDSTNRSLTMTQNHVTSPYRNAEIIVLQID